MMDPPLDSINVLSLIKCQYHIVQVSKKEDTNSEYFIIPANPATGVLYITSNNPEFISGHIRLRGKDEGRYPYNYLEMIENIFGKEDNTIEVCSRSVKGFKESSSSSSSKCFTVDINPKTKPDLVEDAQTLDGISDNKFDRWRCDPPYNQNTAQKMYGTNLPITGELLKQEQGFVQLVHYYSCCLDLRIINGVPMELKELAGLQLPSYQTMRLGL